MRTVNAMWRMRLQCGVRAGVCAWLLSSPLAALPASTPSDADLKNPQWIRAGRSTFAHTCAYCHGDEGDAGKTRAFRERDPSWDPQDIHDTIQAGKIEGANVMPAWGDSISDADIWKLVAYIKSLSGNPKPTP